MRRTTVVLACTLAALGIACSSNKASIPPAAAVEKSSAIATGDRVCTQYATDAKQLIQNFKSSHPQASANDARDFLVNSLVPRTERAVGDFHRIGEPTKDRAGWDEIVRLLDQDLADYKAKISTDPVKVIDTKPFVAEQQKFNDYGFKECGKQLS